jgi:hypothetical protein
VVGAFYDAHGVGVVCGRAWRSPRHNPKPANLIRAQTSAHADGESVAGKALVVHNQAIGCRHMERQSVGAVLEVYNLVRMLDSETLLQRQLANHMPGWIARGAAASRVGER